MPARPRPACRASGHPRRFRATLLLLLASGCAGPLSLTPTRFDLTPGASAPRTLAAEARGTPITGSARPLSAGLRLQPIGQIEQGTVLHPLDTELMIASGDREEADIVVQGTNWVGYYLPFEHAFLPLKTTVTLSLEVPK